MHEYTVGANQQKHHTFVFDQHTAQKEVVLRFYLEADAMLTVQVLIVHISIHVTIECILRGTGAHACIHGAYILSGQQSIILDTFQYHKAAHTSSTLVMKGVLSDAAQAHYQGTINVEQHAQGAYASQENKNIILSSAARAVSVPNLQVLTNDVKCFHGSAIGGFDEQQLFYVAARGIDEKTAQHILLEAFFAEVIDGDGIKKLIEQIKVQDSLRSS